MVNFADALDTRNEDVKKPPVLPQGTYIWTVSKVPTISTTNSGEWDIVEFQIRAVSAEADVDTDELDAFGSLNSAINRVSFMSPTDPAKSADRDRALYRLKKFLTDTLRVDVSDNPSLKEMMAQSVNHQFLGQAVWRQVEDETYVDVKNLAPLD